MTARVLLGTYRQTVCVALAAGMVFVLTSPASFAQSQRSAALTVSVTVVRSCTVETPGTETLPGAPGSTKPTGEPVRIKCGTTILTYPQQPGPTPVPNPLTGATAVPLVSSAAGGKTVTIQF
jgi:hypothetical protein